MSAFLLELYSEEIPAGMQARAAADLEKAVRALLAAVDVTPETAQTYVAPQRLTLMLDGLPAHTEDRVLEKKGPKLDAPEKAVQGFLRANNLADTSSLSVQEHPKGDFYVLRENRAGQSLADILSAGLVPLIEGFVWPKSMRWGAGDLRWVRPLRAILCLFDGAVVPVELDGLQSGSVTYGHRFLAPDAIEISANADYLPKLEAAFVIADADRRREMIAEQAAALAAAEGFDLVDDPALLAETAGLVEWPVCLMGKIDDDFMAVPDEVLTSVMRTHQKYFALKDRKTGKLAPRFITVSNMQTADKGAAIINGNERVLRARLSDGRFFWEQDRKTPLADRLPELEKIVFHAKLGTVREKTERMEILAEAFAPAFGADAAMARQAAGLAKADLVSGMVYEFPELQGIMGGYYAGDETLGAAIRDHYKPLGPDDHIPATAEGCAVALADKIDTLAGFWSIDEKPTGSKDPYALRRAALGVIRILLETRTRLALRDLFTAALTRHGDKAAAAKADELLAFIADRLKVYLRDQGIRHDIIAAVFANSGDDIVELVARARALLAFLQTDDGQNLLAAYRRAGGICSQAEFAKPADIDTALFAEKAEQTLYDALVAAERQPAEDYPALLDALAALRVPVDDFFDAVLVNAEDEKLRINRLSLLKNLINCMDIVAAFELVEA